MLRTLVRGLTRRVEEQQSTEYHRDHSWHTPRWHTYKPKVVRGTSLCSVSKDLCNQECSTRKQEQKDKYIFRNIFKHGIEHTDRGRSNRGHVYPHNETIHAPFQMGLCIDDFISAAFDTFIHLDVSLVPPPRLVQAWKNKN